VNEQLSNAAMLIAVGLDLHSIAKRLLLFVFQVSNDSFLTYQNSTEETEEKLEKVITDFYVGTWDLARKTTNIDPLARNAAL
jgi:hypothetical protein